jgi:2C-methyl-D-erythritol 2,4-cyclodiphosphate synthase
MSEWLRRKSTMTIQIQVSVQTNTFRPRDYDVFGGLDVDHHSIAATFSDHDGLMQSLRLPYSAAQLLNYVRKHFPEQRLAFSQVKYNKNYLLLA